MKVFVKIMKAFISIKSFSSKDARFELMKALIFINSLSSKGVLLDNKWLSVKRILHQQHMFFIIKAFISIRTPLK